MHRLRSEGRAEVAECYLFQFGQQHVTFTDPLASVVIHGEMRAAEHTRVSIDVPISDDAVTTATAKHAAMFTAAATNHKYFHRNLW